MCIYLCVTFTRLCLCVCLSDMCVSDFFFSIAAMQMCLTGRDTERNAVQGGHVEGVT